MIFTSTAREDVNRNTDPEPWACYEQSPVGSGTPSNRHDHEHEGYVYWEPRPEFDTVRPDDPKPWFYALLGRAREGFTPARSAVQETGGFVYQPRPGYRAPQNPILVAFREKVAERGEHPYWGDTYDSFMDWLDYEHDFGPTEGSVCHGYLPAHIEHARKVLTRLVNIYKED